MKCADCRLYHPVVAEKAVEAWRAKIQRWKTECATIKKHNQPHETDILVSDLDEPLRGALARTSNVWAKPSRQCRVWPALPACATADPMTAIDLLASDGSTQSFLDFKERTASEPLFKGAHQTLTYAFNYPIQAGHIAK